mmetsp:Transcript_171751/g.550504  ORF Transcript_171751/g.550504 Transcript_171751/m.550504 type:complete len:439 (-) Transcript_171751:138-1454(-)
MPVVLGGGMAPRLLPEPCAPRVLPPSPCIRHLRVWNHGSSASEAAGPVQFAANHIPSVGSALAARRCWMRESSRSSSLSSAAVAAATAASAALVVAGICPLLRPDVASCELETTHQLQRRGGRCRRRVLVVRPMASEQSNGVASNAALAAEPSASSFATPCLCVQARVGASQQARATAAASEAGEGQVVLPMPVPAVAEGARQRQVAKGIGRIVESLYDNFNRCDVDGTAACFTHDVVYEDLLLGNSTIVESREDFRELIGTHPVFVGRNICLSLGLPPPEVAVCVDAISEDPILYTVGVEWHVEVGGEPLALGRGLSFMKICPRTGLIRQAVDIAEAPWRAVGLVIAPFARGLREFSRLVAGLFLPPVMIMAFWVFVLTGLALAFVDKGTLNSLRADIDSLDDFREGLDYVKVEDLLEALNDLKGVYPWESCGTRRL